MPEAKVFTDFRVGDAVAMRGITPESVHPNMATWRGTVVEVVWKRAGDPRRLGYTRVHWHTGVDSKGSHIDEEMGMEFFEIQLLLGPGDLPPARDRASVEQWLAEA